MGHWAWGMGHGALGIGHWALGKKKIFYQAVQNLSAESHLGDRYNLW
jgi:hypothetical protein